MSAERTRDIMTPDQAANYLQVNRETIYRYVREGKLAASKLGRTYRIPKTSLDLLLWATRTKSDVTLREYSGPQVAQFLKDDQLDEKAQQIADRFLKAASPRSKVSREAGRPTPSP